MIRRYAVSLLFNFGGELPLVKMLLHLPGLAPTVTVVVTAFVPLLITDTVLEPAPDHTDTEVTRRCFL